MCRVVVLFAFCNMYSLASGPVHRFHIPTGTFSGCCVFSFSVCSVDCSLSRFGLDITSTALMWLLLLRVIFISLILFFRHSTTSFVSIHFLLIFLYFFTVAVFLFIFIILPIVEIFLVCLVTHLPIFLYIIFVDLSDAILCIIGWSWLCISVFISLSSFFHRSCLHVRSVCTNSSTVYTLFVLIHFQILFLFVFLWQCCIILFFFVCFMSFIVIVMLFFSIHFFIW